VGAERIGEPGRDAVTTDTVGSGAAESNEHEDRCEEEFRDGKGSAHLNGHGPEYRITDRFLANRTQAARAV